MSSYLRLADGARLETDGEGYLADWREWTRAVAEAMAAADGLVLTADHWKVLDVLRDYYAAYEIAPPMRALLRILKERLNDPELGSRQLYRLFPEGPAKQACRYAGLPRPVSCI